MNNSKVLSQSPISRDPFAMAQQQKESRSVLSSSSIPIQPSITEQPEIMDINPMLEEMGIDSANIANNDIGRMQLIGRLQAKFGDNYMQNKQAYSVLTGFDQRLQQMGLSAQQSSNELVNQSERTLKAIMGG